MITYYDKFSQIIVSQTLASESAAYEESKAKPFYDTNPLSPDPMGFLQSLINAKTNITHVDYNVMVSPRDVNENGVTNDISWGTNHYGFLANQDNIKGYVDDDLFTQNHDGGRHFDMIGGFVNSSHTDVPSWGSHS